MQGQKLRYEWQHMESAERRRCGDPDLSRDIQRAAGQLAIDLFQLLNEWFGPIVVPATLIGQGHTTCASVKQPPPQPLLERTDRLPDGGFRIARSGGRGENPPRLHH